jgi:hypothetical protein
MRPPIRRAPAIRISRPGLWVVAVRNAGAVLVTILLARLASLLASSEGESSFSDGVTFFTEPIVWPLQQVPLMGNQLGRGVSVADVVVLLLVFGLTILLTGIVVGWERESTTIRPR